MEEITRLRKKIESLDQKLLKIIVERFELSEAIGQIKKEQNVPIHQPEKEKEKIKNFEKETKLHKSFIKKLFTLIFEESRKKQN